MPAFDSGFGLAFDAGATVPPVSYAIELTLGPPILGAPWSGRLQPEGLLHLYGPPPPPVPAPLVYAPEIASGPPLRGAPWLARLPITEEGNLYGPPPPPPVAPLVYAPEQVLGPPVPGAPWNLRRPIPEEAWLYGPPPPPPPPPETHCPEITTGPPLRGAPWLGRVPIPEESWLRGTVVLPGNRGGSSVPTSSMPFLPRISATSDLRRLNRFSEKLSILVNSLIGQQILVQQGPDSWQIRIDGGTF